ncbi:cobalt-precorrin-6A reductase [Rhodovibrionaceae bacterium A322]
MITSLLILGGTGDAFNLAQRLARSHPALRVVTSLAGRTDRPRLPEGEIRQGGFGGPEGLASYLQEEQIEGLVDATHPFAAQISENAVEGARLAGIPLVRLARQAWQAEEGDLWVEAESPDDAAALLPKGARVFLTVGRQELDAFSQRSDCWFLVRLVDPPKDPLPFGRYEVVLGRGPFRLKEESDLLAHHGIDVVVTKNSGGMAASAKLMAARHAGLPVTMIARPSLPACHTVNSLEDVLVWLNEV